MRKPISRFLLLMTVSCLSLLFVSCVSGHKSSDSGTVKGASFAPDSQFFVYVGDDPINLAPRIAKVFEDNDLYVETVDEKYVPEPKAAEGYGSGFFISPEIIVTNAHVVQNETDIKYYLDGIEHHAVPLYIDENVDLAFLLAERNDNPYFRLGNYSDYDVLSVIFALGYPLTEIMGNNIKVTSGVINSLSGPDDNQNFIQFSAQLQPGNSGGPVVNSEYTVIGIANSKLSDAYTLLTQGTVTQDVDYAIKGDLVSFYSSEYVPLEPNYVSNLKEAMSATVKIEVGNAKFIGKQYAVSFSYIYNLDLIHWTLTELNITCYDLMTGYKAAEASYHGISLSSGKTLARKTTKQLLEYMGLLKEDDDDEKEDEDSSQASFINDYSY